MTSTEDRRLALSLAHEIGRVTNAPAEDVVARAKTYLAFLVWEPDYGDGRNSIASRMP
jgi:hypothetical protein